MVQSPVAKTKMELTLTAWMATHAITVQSDIQFAMMLQDTSATKNVTQVMASVH